MIGLDPKVLGSGTTLVTTETVDVLLTMAPVTFDAGYIVALDGPAGCGKTTALTALKSQFNLPVSCVSLDPRSSDKDVIKQLHSAIVGVPVSRRALRTELLGDLRLRLAASPRIVIVDEAQNLTPHEVKTIITRAGEGTKIVFTGDIFQIDHPYLYR